MGCGASAATEAHTDEVQKLTQMKQKNIQERNKYVEKEEVVEEKVVEVSEPKTEKEEVDAKPAISFQEAPNTQPVVEDTPQKQEENVEKKKEKVSDPPDFNTERFVRDVKKWMSFAEYCSHKKATSDEDIAHARTIFSRLPARRKTLTMDDRDVMVAKMFNSQCSHNSDNNLSLVQLWQGPQNFVNPLPALINMAVQDIGLVDGTVDAEEHDAYQKGSSFIKEPRFSQSLFNALVRKDDAKYVKSFKGPITSVTVEKFSEHIVGGTKLSDEQISTIVENLKTQSGTVDHDTLTTAFDGNKVDFDFWEVSESPATGEIDIDPQGVVTQESLNLFVDNMVGVNASDINKSAFEKIESSLKTHIEEAVVNDTVKTIAKQFNLVQFIKDTAINHVMDNEAEMDFGTFVLQVADVLEGQIDINPEDDDEGETVQRKNMDKRKTQGFALMDDIKSIQVFDAWEINDFSGYKLNLSDDTEVSEFITQALENTNLEKVIAMDVCKSAGIPLENCSTTNAGGILFPEVMCFFAQFAAEKISFASKSFLTDCQTLWQAGDKSESFQEFVDNADNGYAPQNDNKQEEEEVGQDETQQEEAAVEEDA